MAGSKAIEGETGRFDEPVFSEDGRAIIHSSNRGGASNIWSMRPDGTNPVRLTTGSGPDEAAIRTAAAQHGVTDRVHLLGYVSDEEKYRALSVADVFVSTSQRKLAPTLP